jgi:LPPG:FO 2-phospho-L-lactate transferase
VKGPTAKIMKELGAAVSSMTIAEHYRGLINGLVIDTADAADAGRLDIRCTVTRTLMKSLEDRRSLARDVVIFADQLVRERESA